MFNRRGITPADKLAQDSTLSRQNGLTGPLLILQEDVSGHPTYGCKQDLSAPPLFLLPELQTGSVGSTPIFSKQDMYRLNRMWPSTTVNSAIDQSDAFRSIRRPIRDKLGSYRYAGLERIIYMLILFSQYVINSFTLYTFNKVCIGPLCFEPT